MFYEQAYLCLYHSGLYLFPLHQLKIAPHLSLSPGGLILQHFSASFPVSLRDVDLAWRLGDDLLTGQWNQVHLTKSGLKYREAVKVHLVYALDHVASANALF